MVRPVFLFLLCWCAVGPEVLNAHQQQEVRARHVQASAARLSHELSVNDWTSNDDEDVEENLVGKMDVDAVLEQTATLPCDIEPDTREDRVYMVLWFKEGLDKPLYSFDVRGRSFNKALHWSDTNEFGQRAYFVTVSRPAALTLDSVTLNDAGVYRCRVDFKNSPTRNFQINLTVIVPPSNLFIYDRSGRDIVDTVGPLEEGADLVLTCEVRGGRPQPTVSWFINERLADGRLTETHDNVIVSRLEVPRVRRHHLNATFKCQASNTKLRLPFEKTIRLELLLRPLSVRMLHKPRQLIADSDYIITCEAVGSRPKAQISWIRDARKFRRGKIIEGGNETVVTSSVTFAPVPEDDGTILKCIGDNPSLPGTGIEDSIILNVVYPPQVALHLGSTLDPEAIKEGDDVYFECSIRANPKEHKITWFHNGVLVTQNMSSGIIISSHSLVLQKVTRLQSGAYTCLASNPRGETLSLPIFLRVRFAPVCYSEYTITSTTLGTSTDLSSSGDMTVIGASQDEVVRVRCRVAADPGDDVQFVWQFNNSGESFPVAPSRLAAANGSVSELMYTPTGERDYGTLACWGKNAVGTQRTPCVFQIVPAAKPHALRNCTLRSGVYSNSTSATSTSASVNTNAIGDVLEVECVAGYDGGLPQTFVLEAYESRTHRLRLNLTSSGSDVPLFRIDMADLVAPMAAIDSRGPGGEALQPPTLQIVLYAQNQKGRSESTVLEDIALNDAEKRTDGSNAFTLVPVAALVTGALLTLGLAVLLLIVLAVRRRRRPQSRGAAQHTHCTSLHNNDIDKRKLSPASMLEINTGEHRYVVAYTLKPVEGANGGAQTEHLVGSPPGGRKPSPPPPPPAPNHVVYGGGVSSFQSHHTQQPDILNTPPGVVRSGFQAGSPRSPQTPLVSVGRPDGLFPAPATPPHSLDIASSYAGVQFATQPNSLGINNFAMSTSNSSSSSPSSAMGQCSTLGRARSRPRPVPFTSHTGTLRRDHIITDSIPGPESCV